RDIGPDLSPIPAQVDNALARAAALPPGRTGVPVSPRRRSPAPDDDRTRRVESSPARRPRGKGLAPLAAPQPRDARARAGAPIHLVQATLGHASVATTGRYLHARPTDSSSRYLAV